MTSEICMHYYVSGKVQGVYFRAFTVEHAKRLGLRGFARNLPDGRVEVIACGTKEHVALFYAFLQQGPSRAKVTDVSYEEIAWQEHPDFVVL
jgi:acylphosphatase